jgi:hypothetical protein
MIRAAIPGPATASAMFRFRKEYGPPKSPPGDAIVDV